MEKIVDKILILLICSFMIFTIEFSPITIIGFLLAIIVTSLNTYFSNSLVYVLSIVFSLLIILFPIYVLLTPIIAYDLMSSKNRYLRFLWVVPILASINGSYFISSLLVSVVSVFLSNKSDRIIFLKQEFYNSEDEKRESIISNEERKIDLEKQQEDSLRLATLSERNRIAREIHDNVGHLLTRSILQVNAIEVMSDEEEKNSSLGDLKDTLSEAMDSIRASVHGIHDNYYNFEEEVKAIISKFNFCPIKLNYDTRYVSKDIRHSFVMILKEGLSNIIKHSNASLVEVAILEYESLYKMTIEDNGTSKVKGKGIGLISIEERVEALNGLFRVEEDESSFRLVINIPKLRS